MIDFKNGVFDQIKFKPWPRIITNLEINSWGHRTHVFGKRKDHCVLYYNQPFFHKNFLALKYIVSNRGTSFASFQLAQKILDLVAKIKCTDALVCEINNERIPAACSKDGAGKNIDWVHLAVILSSDSTAIYPTIFRRKNRSLLLIPRRQKTALDFECCRFWQC